MLKKGVVAYTCGTKTSRLYVALPVLWLSHVPSCDRYSSMCLLDRPTTNKPSQYGSFHKSHKTNAPD